MLDHSMVLLADAYYDALEVLDAMTGTGAAFLLRSTRKRRPAVRRLLPDSSYLTTVCAGKHKAGRGYGQLEERIVEARMTVTLADGTRRSELWRVVTSLLNAERYPAHELIALYHRRWVLLVTHGPWDRAGGLRPVYQALVRIAYDVVTAQPLLSAQRVSFIVLFNAAADQIVAARGIAPTGPSS